MKYYLNSKTIIYDFNYRPYLYNAEKLSSAALKV